VSLTIGASQTFPGRTATVARFTSHRAPRCPDMTVTPKSPIYGAHCPREVLVWISCVPLITATQILPGMPNDGARTCLDALAGTRTLKIPDSGSAAYVRIPSVDAKNSTAVDLVSRHPVCCFRLAPLHVSCTIYQDRSSVLACCVAPGAAQWCG